MRLGRRYPFQPQLQGPIVISPMALPLEDQRTILVVRPDRRRERDARQTTTFLRPPVLAAAVALTYDQQRLRLVLAEQPGQRPLSSKLSAPAAAALTEGQQRLRVVLAADTSAQQRPLASKLSPPIFQQAVDPVETVVRVVKAVRARFDRRDAQQPILGAPVVIDPMALPLEDQRTVNVVIPKADQRQQRRKSSSRLFPPVVGQAPSPVVTRLLSVFAPRVRLRELASRLFPPAVVDQPPVVTRLLTSLSESPRFRQLGTKVRPPAVLAAPAAPVETTIRVVKAVRARFDRRKAMQPVLRGPIVVDPAAAGGPPVETDLRVVFPVRTQRQRYATKYELQPPAVVSTASAPGSARSCAPRRSSTSPPPPRLKPTFGLCSRFDGSREGTEPSTSFCRPWSSDSPRLSPTSSRRSRRSKPVCSGRSGICPSRGSSLRRSSARPHNPRSSPTSELSSRFGFIRTGTARRTTFCRPRSSGPRPFARTLTRLAPRPSRCWGRRTGR
jgi:hypothetical protein